MDKVDSTQKQVGSVGEVRILRKNQKHVRDLKYNRNDECVRWVGHNKESLIWRLYQWNPQTRKQKEQKL